MKAIPSIPPRTEIASHHEARFQDSLEGFGRLLQGRFHRAPEGAPPTPLNSAIARIAELVRVKPLPVRLRDGEDRDAFLERAMTTHGLRLRRILVEPGAIPEGGGPILAFDPDDRPVLLVPRPFGGYMLEDPTGAVSPRRFKDIDRSTLQPEVFAVYRTLPDGKLGYRAVLGFGLKDSAWDLGLLVGCGMVGSLLALLPPIAAAHIANTAVHTADLAFLANLLLVLLVAVLAETTFFAIGRIAELRSEGRAGFALHAAMLDRLLRLPAETLRGSNTLILATQAETVGKFRRALMSFAATGVLAVANGLAAAVLVAWVAPLAGLIAIGLVLLLVGLASFLSWAQFKAIYEGERMDVVVLAFVYDLVRLIPVLRASRMEKRAFTQWCQNFLAFQSRLMRSARISNQLAVAEPVWDAAALALCFAVLAYAGATGAISAGEAIVFVLALAHLIRAGRELAHVLMGAGKQLPMAKLARPLLEHPVEPLLPGLLGPTLSGGAEMRNVNFFYGTRRALADVNLTVAPGEFVGLVGRSGSGKSTLLSLLLGLDKPHSGQVLLDGHDMGGLDRRQIARQIGVVMQGSRLFSGSIYENIRGVNAISLDEAWEFAAQAGIADELRALPMGLNTIVGESSSGLSVGQVHRILIARALAGRPAILVLDEALSSLDGRVQERILATLAGLDLTRILVTHRPSALVAADRVIVLDQGSIADVGSLKEIITRQSFFQSMWQKF